MSLFEPNPAELAAAQPLINWLNDATPAEVAVELMAAFGSDGAEPVGAGVSRNKLIEWLFREYPKSGARGRGILGVHPTASYPVANPVSEALQLLEHSELVMFHPWFEAQYPQLRWLATRLGLSTLAAGKAAVRQRIADRTGL